MIVIAVVGLLILAAAATLGATGVLSNRGTGHQISQGFDAFGHTFHGSAGQLFFWGLVTGAGGFFGLLLLYGGLRGSWRRARMRPAPVPQSEDHRAREPQHAAAPEPLADEQLDAHPGAHRDTPRDDRLTEPDDERVVEEEPVDPQAETLKNAGR